MANGTRTSVVGTQRPTDTNVLPDDNRSSLSFLLSYGPADPTLRALVLLSSMGMGVTLGFIFARLRP